jgi:hypothetical protein
MSEYQYYELQALDLPLSQEQMAHLRDVSSRAQITPHSFVNEYNWGSFKGNPDQWMARYFDAFLHFANWGSRRFMLRLPTKLLDRKTVESYCEGESLSCWQKDGHTILSFDAELEDFERGEESISLASLISIRADLIRGDYRALYLRWLLAVQCKKVGKKDIEPPVPSGLGHRHGSLDCLAAFLAIDPDLIAAAAESSADEQLPVLSKTQIDQWVRSLPSADKDAIVTRLIDGGDLHISAEVRQRAICAIAGNGRSRERQRRTAAEILTRGETIAAERKKRDAEERAKEKARRERAEADARKKRFESLAGKENHLWSTVDKLIATKQPRRYDEAVSLLKDLHDLAVLKGKSGEFKSRMAALERANAAKGTLIERFRKANPLEYEREEAS